MIFILHKTNHIQFKSNRKVLIWYRIDMYDDFE